MNLTQEYRPKSLDEVVGHKLTVDELKKRCEDNNLPQVMMFTGRSGLGKTTLGRIIAKNILCNNKDSKGNSCNKCHSCLAIDDEKPLINYFEKDGYDLNIEVIRDIEDLASKKIAFDQSNKKVFVIDELQALNRNQQALKKSLKFLERPYTGVYFILGSMEWLKLPPAIKNRTVMYKLSPLKDLEIAEYLYNICKKRNLVGDTLDIQQQDVLLALAQSSSGSLRTAISVLERVIYSNLWTLEKIEKELKIYNNNSINMLIQGVLNKDIEALKDINIDEDTLDIIRKRLNLIYRFKSGIKLEDYEISDVKDIKGNITIESVELFIVELNNLYKYTYLTPELIEFTFISVLNKIKVLKKNTETITKRPLRKTIEN